MSNAIEGNRFSVSRRGLHWQRRWSRLWDRLPANVQAAWNCLRGRPTVYRVRLPITGTAPRGVQLFGDDHAVITGTRRGLLVADVHVYGVPDIGVPMFVAPLGPLGPFSEVD